MLQLDLVFRPPIFQKVLKILSSNGVLWRLSQLLIGGQRFLLDFWVSHPLLKKLFLKSGVPFVLEKYVVELALFLVVFATVK